MGKLVRASVLAALLVGLAAPAVPAEAVEKQRSLPAVPGAKKVLKVDPSAVQRARTARRAQATYTAPDGSTGSLVEAPADGPALSTWQVTYTGFDAASNPDGPAAQEAFQAAVDIWSRIVTSSVPIKVKADFAALPSYVLGQAGPTLLYGLQEDDDSVTFVPSALADARLGVDVGAGNSGNGAFDISATFNSQPVVPFYYGTDGLASAGESDFLSVVLHELGHGLGFVGSGSVSGSNGTYESVPYSYDRHTWDALSGGSPVRSYESGTPALKAVLTSNSLYWGGSEGVTANSGARPRLYAPTTFEPGSSYSHLDETTYGVGHESSLMTPTIGTQEVVHSPGPLAVALFRDMGWSAALPVDTLGAPQTVAAVPGDSSIAVTWQAPATDGGSPVTGYTAAAAPGGASCTTAGLGCTITGLTNGTAYSVTVTATNAEGTGPASAAISATPRTVPSAPRSVAGIPQAGAVVLSWVTPLSNGGAVITSYTATSSPGGKTCSSGGTGCTVTGLTNGTGYTFTVTATNAAGTGAASAASATVTPRTSPDAPTGVVATVQDAALGVSWTAPAFNGGAAVTSYTATASPGGASCTVPGTSCTLSGLTNGTSYTVTVTASNIAGASSPSAASDPAVPVGPPGSPTGVTATAGSGTALVSWVAPTSSGGSPITGYTATASPGGASCQTTGLTCSVGTLVNGTSYTFTVTATNALGTSAASTPSAAVTPAPPDTVAPVVTPGALPTAVLATAAVFTYSATDSGSGVASYDVASRRSPYNGAFSSLPTRTGLTVKSVSVPRAAGWTYCFRVRARDVAGNVSGWSAERCTAFPLDDRALVAGTGWTRVTGSAYYLSTATTSARTGSVLSVSSVQKHRYATLVATTCSTCGSVGVYVGNVLRKTVSLRSSTTAHRKLLLVDLGAAYSGTVAVKPLSTARVTVDGIAFTRL